MARLAVIGAVIAAVCAGAVVASACTPQAYITLDKPAYTPGETVTATGRGFAPSAATPVTVTWGANGPVIGQAPIAADGMWELSFTVPARASAGTYVIYAVAYDAAGAVIDGLPARVQFPVEAPAAPPVVVPVAPPAAPPQTHPVAHARTAPKPSAAPAPPAPVARSAAPLPQAAITAPAGPSRTSVIRVPAVPRVVHVPLTRTTAPGLAAPLPVAVTATQGHGTPWLLLAVGALGFLLLGAGSGGLVAARRRPPTLPTDSVEAELQELLGEELARQSEVSHR